MSSMCDYDYLSFVIVDGNLQRYQGKDPHVVIPDCVTKISKVAFQNKLGIESITVPGTVQNLGIDTFSQIQSLKELILKPGSAKFTSINGALCSADGKKLLMVPRGVDAFEIPESVTEIGREAFNGCGKLQTIVFPPAVTVIGANIFGYASPAHIVVCNPAAMIDENAFRMETLEKCFLCGTLDVPPSVLKAVATSVKRRKKLYAEQIIRVDNIAAMKQFLSLWKTLKPEELEAYIQMAEKAQSIGVRDVLLKKRNDQSTTEVPAEAKSSIQNEDTLKQWRERLKLTVSKDQITVTGYSGTDVNVTIPKEIEGKQITELKPRAFAMCTFVKSVTIHAELSIIKASLFGGCSSLETVVLPENLTAIGEFAFRGCSKLSGIALPDTLTRIDDAAFKDCSALESVEIPGSVIVLGKSAFSGCAALKRVALSEQVDVINMSSFQLCSSLEEIVIPPSVTKIDLYAFGGCSSLKKILVSENVRYIAPTAFYNCKQLAIHAPAGCYAEQFAKENNIPFVAE